MKRTIGILNGPNINRLGKREPHIYGTQTFDQFKEELSKKAKTLGVELIFFESSNEGDLVEKLYEWGDSNLAAVILNPGAYEHSSIAIRDAVSGCGLMTIAVHLTNISAREEFRHKLMVTPACIGSVTGLGTAGYGLALEYLVSKLT